MEISQYPMINNYNMVFKQYLYNIWYGGINNNNV